MDAHRRDRAPEHHADVTDPRRRGRGGCRAGQRAVDRGAVLFADGGLEERARIRQRCVRVRLPQQDEHRRRGLVQRERVGPRRGGSVELQPHLLDAVVQRVAGRGPPLAQRTDPSPRVVQIAGLVQEARQAGRLSVGREDALLQVDVVGSRVKPAFEPGAVDGREDARDGTEPRERGRRDELGRDRREDESERVDQARSRLSAQARGSRHRR